MFLVRWWLQSLLCAVVVLGAGAQTPDFSKRLEEGQQLRAAGRYAEAQKALAGMLREARKSGLSTALTALVEDNLAATEQDLGDYTEAERLLTDAISQLKKSGALESAEMAAAKGHLGEVYLEEARYREAETVLRQALEIHQNREDTQAIAIDMIDLSMSAEHTRRLPEAETLLRQAVDVLETQYGPNTPLLATALGPLSAVLMREGRNDEALRSTERAWKILRGDPSVAEPDLLNTMSALGTLYALTGRNADGEFYSHQAAERAEAIYGSDHPRVGWYLKSYALVLKRTNHNAEAKAVDKRAEAILARSQDINPVQHTINVNALR